MGIRAYPTGENYIPADETIYSPSAHVNMYEPTYVVFMGGWTGAASNVIDWVNLTVHNSIARDFGDLTATKRYGNVGGAGSATRGLFAGTVSAGNVIEYITFLTLGNAVDFGDLSVGRQEPGGLHSTTRAVFGGGYVAPNSNVMDYVTVATTGNATDFGDLSAAREGPAGISSTIYGVFAGGWVSAANNVMDYITIATTGNATDYGDLSVARWALTSLGSTTRGVFLGGNTTGTTYVNTIDYIVLVSGNATDFGDLTALRKGASGGSSLIKGIVGGGAEYIAGADAAVTTCEYITIATTGNSADFGDLSVARYYLSSCDNKW